MEESQSVASAVAAALAQKSGNVAIEAQTAVLEKQLDAEQEIAARLLAMMGKGANLNVVG